MISKPDISVVIPTIGNRSLIPTLKSLNNSSIGINEIIISIPFDVEIETGLFQNFSNIIKLREGTFIVHPYDVIHTVYPHFNLNETRRTFTTNIDVYY